MRLPCLLLLLLAWGGRTPLCELAAEEAARTPVWKHEVAIDGSIKLGGVAIGDVDSSRPGNEIVAVGQDGSVQIAWRKDGAWREVLIAQSSGELLQCAIGDVEPDVPGNEIVAVGMKSGAESATGAGIVYVLHRAQAQDWSLTPVFEDKALVHGVCVADMNPDRPGPEILAVGFSLAATLIESTPERWTATQIATLPSPGKHAVAHDGGAVVACAGGELVHLARRDGEWVLTTLDRAKAGQARVDSQEGRVLSCRDDGALGLFEDGKRVDVYREQEKLRGAILADLDPSCPGMECATASHGARVVIVGLRGERWQPSLAYTGSDRFHHLVAGELIEAWGGVELAVSGYDGKVVVIGRGN